MVNEELLSFIKQQLARGKKKEDIIATLVATGWDLNNVNEGLDQVQGIAEAPKSIAYNKEEEFQGKTTKSKRSKKLFVIILIIFIVLGLVGASVGFAYYYVFPSPDRILGKMAERIAYTETASYNSKIELSIAKGDQTISTTIKLDGAFDIRDMNNMNSRNVITLENFSSNLLPSEIIQNPIRFETIIADQVLYAKIVLVNTKADLGFFSIDLSPINDEWIKFTPESLQESVPGLETSLDVNSYKLSDEQIEQIRSAYKNARVFKLTEKLKSEKIDGVSTHHFSAVIDERRLVELAREIILITDLEEKKLFEDIDYEEKEDLKAFDDLKIEFWVGKWDWVPRKISLELTTTESNTDYVFSLKEDLLLKDFNKPVVIEAPPPPIKTFVEAIEELSAQWNNSFNYYGLDAPTTPGLNTNAYPLGSDSIDSDNDELTDTMEAFWGTDPNNPDTDGDGYMDGEEVNNEYDPLRPGKLNIGETNVMSQFNNLNSEQANGEFKELIRGIQTNVPWFSP